MTGIMACLLMLNMTGCMKSTVRTIKDGVYEGTGMGYGGEITTSVTFQDGKMKDIQVLDEAESDVIASSALKNVPNYILSGQSFNVDVSSGATITSEGIKNSVKDAIQKAGGNLEEWNEDCTGKHMDPVTEVHTDVAVIGGGTSGIATALRLSQMGIDTTIAERASVLGGILRHTEYATEVITGNSSKKEEIDYEAPEEICEDIRSFARGEVNESALKIIQDNLKDTVRWQKDILGITFLNRPVENQIYSGNALSFYDNAGGSIGELLAKEADVSGARILTDMAVTGVEEKDDSVLVTGKGRDGTVYKIDSEYAVIASGSGALFQSADGPSIRMNVSGTKESGYRTIEDPKVLGQSIGLTFGEGRTVDSYDALKEVLNKGALLVNSNGQRFVNESKGITELGHAVANQGGVTYLVMNESAYSHWKTVMEKDAVITREERNALISDSADGIYKANTLSELCTLTGVPESELSITLDQYHQDVLQASQDKNYVDALGRSSYDNDIETTSPMYAVRLDVYDMLFSGEIETDSSLRLIKENGDASERVYAVGSACGEIFGEQAPEGMMNTWSFVSGKKVADTIAKNLSPKAYQSLQEKEAKE